MREKRGLSDGFGGESFGGDIEGGFSTCTGLGVGEGGGSEGGEGGFVFVTVGVGVGEA